MSTSLSSYKTQLTAAQTAYQAALQTLYSTLIDLEALTICVEKIGGAPQTHFGASTHDELQNLFRYLEHPVAAPRDKHFGGTLVASSGTTTSSPTLNITKVPAWVVPGLVVTNVTAGNAVGTVLSAGVNGTTITLAANAANAVTAGDQLSFAFIAAERIVDKIRNAAQAYISNWSGS